VRRRTRYLVTFLALVFSSCGPGDTFRQPTCEQRLPSGKSVKVTSCQLVWGADHDQRFPNQDAFALEYVSSLSPSAEEDLDREVLEVFELIRHVSEQWDFSTASVAAFPTAERTGPYVQFAFARSATGAWTFRRHSAKVFNTESGRKPE
jgi:hypothetical protein